MNTNTIVQSRSTRTQHGVSMIEILVTLLVLSIGLLGLAALQGLSLQSNQVSLLRTQATNFAYEVADHARANRSIVIDTGSLPNSDFWTTRAAGLLPNGIVATSLVGNDGLRVTVTWLDDREAGITATFVVNTRI